MRALPTRCVTIPARILLVHAAEPHARDDTRRTTAQIPLVHAAKRHARDDTRKVSVVSNAVLLLLGKAIRATATAAGRLLARDDTRRTTAQIPLVHATKRHARDDTRKVSVVSNAALLLLGKAIRATATAAGRLLKRRLCDNRPPNGIAYNTPNPPLITLSDISVLEGRCATIMKNPPLMTLSDISVLEGRCATIRIILH